MQNTHERERVLEIQTNTLTAMSHDRKPHTNIELNINWKWHDNVR